MSKLVDACTHGCSHSSREYDSVVDRWQQSARSAIVAMQATVVYFYSLAALAVILLWGISLVNGTVYALLKAVLTHNLAANEFATKYTGIAILDFPIALLVAFFYTGTNGHSLAYQHFLLNAYATLQPAFVWLYVERSRLRVGKCGLLQSPLFYGMLWQCFGAAISLPLFYAQHVLNTGQYTTGRYQEPWLVQSIPAGYVLGAVIPVLIGMWPTWGGPVSASSRTPRTHQYILAAWQLDPMYVAGIQYLLTWALMARSTPYCSGQRPAYQWARLSYAIAAFTSAMGHWHLLFHCFVLRTDGIGVVQMFVPFPNRRPHGADGILEKGPWLFLQYDFFIIALSSLSWVYLLLRGLERQLSGSRAALILLLGAGSIMIGAGATVSLALAWRERALWTRACAEEENGSVVQKARRIVNGV